MKLSEYITDQTFVRQAQTFSFGTKEECKALMIEAFELTDKTSEFEWLPEYDEIAEWLSNNEGKGILMTGNVGRGKSAILQGVLPLIFRARAKKVLHVFPARELHNQEKFKWCVCIDDIGQDGVVNDYGTKVDAVEDAISHCEDRMKLLFMTSNLSKKQIEKRYGKRILDRIERLCRIVVFQGESKRK